MDTTIHKNLQMLLNLPNTYENFRYAMIELPNLETLKIKI